ncbi:YczE/YyaS/YitT family protein [Arenimonas donghaensis]|uniref:Membrane protein YczE n=1 Tax=Arenimonas donghaensis DSM 18148 = HO3-R19 TaxID=1121014 RepID=A0A087MFE6_9GAMM|nr:membrane protein [Arenimonas donghaensis]KFL35599.1 hypothetical protein N788_07645 [Arenimonas donghaensis DSM 18148 = HO3-R19]
MDKTNQMHGLANIGPLAQLRAGRLPERLLRLFVGLWLYGLSVALMVQGALGTSPWDVFHQGALQHVPRGLDMSLGNIMVLTSMAVLLAWVPLRQMPGLGTLANAFCVGPFTDLNLWWLGAPEGLALRAVYMLAGVACCGLATALYVGAQLGPGPRDGLMTGLARRTGRSIRFVRTGIEASVVVLGATLGGPVGLGTVVFALAVGPLTQRFLPCFVVRLGDDKPVKIAREAT